MTHDFTFFSPKLSRVSLPPQHYHIGYLYPRLIWHHHLPQLLQGNASPTSLFFQVYASCTNSNGRILQLCYVFSYTHAALVFYIIYCTVSPLSSHILRIGFSDVLSILFFVQFVLNACSCVAHIVAWVCTLRAFCTTHFQDNSLGISRTNCPHILTSRHLLLNSFWIFFLNSSFSIRFSVLTILTFSTSW